MSKNFANFLEKSVKEDKILQLKSLDKQENLR